MPPASGATVVSLPSEPDAASARRIELRTRIVSSAVLAPVALAAGYLGGLAFAAVVGLVGTIGLWEWGRITGAGKPEWLRVGAAACLALGLLLLALGRPDWAIALIAVPAVLALVAGARLRASFWTGLGLAYVGVPCAALIILRQAGPAGWASVLFILLVVWATDIGAYFGGRRIGGPKLWPRVSPNKTWSGALTGVVAAILAGGLTVRLTGAGDLAAGLLLAAPLSIASQAGDLLESALKRRFGVKDSGHVIPGHGGVLDRVDGLFGAAALAWLVAALELGGDLLALPQDIALPGGAS